MGALPAQESIASDAIFQDSPITKKVIDDWLPVAGTTGAKSPGVFPALNDFEGSGVVQTLTQDLLQGKDVTASMQKLQTSMQSIIK
jgi:multiple sugar transport system substrate-binding protein